MTVVVFEDQQCELLAPITHLRPAAAIQCGSFRLVDFLELLFGETFYVGRSHLSGIQRHDFTKLKDLSGSLLQTTSIANDTVADQKVALLLNARIAPTVENFQTLQILAETLSKLPPEQATNSHPQVILDGEQVAAVIAPTWSLHYLMGAGFLGSDDWIQKAKTFSTSNLKLRTLSYPHEVIATNMSALQDNLELRVELSDLDVPQYSKVKEIAQGVFAADDVNVSSFVEFDTTHGTIFLESGVQIEAFSRIQGPVYLGPRCAVKSHASITNGASVGQDCALGGEIEASVIEAYTSKLHHGYLGYSYVGSWVYLGAGTANAEIKSNGGLPSVEYADGRQTLEMDKLGCVIGDYCKTSVNTGLFSGKQIGPFSVLYGYVATDVPSFTNFAQTFGKTTVISPELATSIQKRTLANRNVQQRSCDIQVIHDLYSLTQIERDCAGAELAIS